VSFIGSSALSSLLVFAFIGIFFVAIGFFVVIPIIIGVALKGSLKKVAAIPTFDEYSRANPHLVNNGRVSCVKCNGSSIFLQRVATMPTSIISHHVCRTCGTALYRSTN